MKYSYQTQGTCSRRINLDIEDGIIREVSFEGGCHGNLQGIGRLVTGMKADEVIARLQGVRCRDKLTSCPDQLSKALQAALSEDKKEAAL